MADSLPNPSGRLVRGPWVPPDPTPPGRPRGAYFPLVVAAIVALGTQPFVSPEAPLVRLASGHRYLTRPLAAALLPSGAWEALDQLLAGLDHLVVAALALLVLGWGAGAAGFGARSFRRGLPASLLVLLVTVLLWSFLGLLFDAGPGLGALDRGTALAGGAAWLRGIGDEALFRGALQAGLVVGLHRLLGRSRPGTAVVLGILVAAAWGAAVRIPELRAGGREGWSLLQALLHGELLLGLVLGAVYARTGNLVFTGGLHGASNVMAAQRLPGWPETASTDLLLAVALLLVTVFLGRGLLPPHGPDDVVRRHRS